MYSLPPQPEGLSGRCLDSVSRRQVYGGVPPSNLRVGLALGELSSGRGREEPSWEKSPLVPDPLVPLGVPLVLESLRVRLRVSGTGHRTGSRDGKGEGLGPEGGVLWGQEDSTRFYHKNFLWGTLE